MSETYREENEINEVDFRLTKDEFDWEHDRNCELENDHADELAPAEDNDPIQ